MDKPQSVRQRDAARHSEEILAAARAVFFIQEYADASIDEISLTAGFTKRTLYRYFQGKEDLYFAVAAECFEMLIERMERTGSSGNDGYSRVMAAAASYREFRRNEPGRFRVISSARRVRTGEAASRHHTRMLACFEKLMGLIIRWTGEGQQDRTIRGDIPPVMLAQSVTALVMGLFDILPPPDVAGSEAGMEQALDTAIRLIGDSLKYRE